MFRKIILSAVSALALATGRPKPPKAKRHVEDFSFSFEGPFGKYDQFQLQRGLQVFTEVCAACHGLKYVPIRTLADPGGPELPADQVRAYAASLDCGRAARWRPNVPANGPTTSPCARARGWGRTSALMAKARAGFHGPYGTGINQLFRGMGGPEYIVALLTGYTGRTKDEAGSTFYENHAFPTGWIAMPPPLSDGLVEYADGHPNDAAPHGRGCLLLPDVGGRAEDDGAQGGGLPVA
jgi:ubiquinol-cytochrome c reductase cytochrome c1 subunit